ncbi:polyketide synthase dehydratase domain-containing protein, partial [Streptosporangium album]|uniref:polyketide synthase dehydratase domain-containing protein n=1 Tax=Streptosporangium album TaxID=47479 RepID=UPI0031E5230E
MREAVRFCDGVRFLEEQGVTRFVELGPDAVLTGMAQECVDPARAALVAVLRRGRPEGREVLAALARLHVAGLSPDWGAVYGGSGAQRVDLPTYAFQHRRYWLEAPVSQGEMSAAGLAAAGHPMLSAVVALPSPDGPGSDGVVLTGRVSLGSHAWLADHVISGVTVLPGTAFVELAIKAGDQVGCGLLDELTLEAPLVVPERDGAALQVVVGGGDEYGRRLVEVYSRPVDASPEESWTRHASGVVGPDAPPEPAGLVIWPPRGGRSLDITGVYEDLATQGYEYGPEFQGLRAVWQRGDEIFAEVALAEGTSAEGFGLHPALLDAALHAALVAEDGGQETQLPFAWTGVSLHAAGASALRVRIARSGTASSIEVTDETGRPVASVGSLVSRPVAVEQLRAAGRGESLFQVEWWPFAGGAATGAGPCALVGDDAFGLSVLPEVVGVHADLAALAGVDVPEVVILPGLGEPAEDMPAEVRSATGRMLALVQEWLAEERFAMATLAVVTRGAVSVAGEDVTDLAGAAVWGLVRAAQAENPGRLVLVDLDGQGLSLESVLAAVAAGEPELAVRDGEVVVPRLAKAVVQGQASPWSAEGTVLV